MEFILFPHANEQRRRRDKAHCGHGARRPGRPAPHTHFKLVLAVVSSETASWALWCVLSFYQKKKRKRGNKSRLFPPTERTRSGRGGASRGRRHLSYLSRFFPPRRPLRLSIPSAPFLSLSLPSLSRSLARSLDLSLSSPPTRRRRERRLSVAALVPIWRVRMCRVMYRYLHNPSADVCEDSRKKSRKERKWKQPELVIPVKFPSAIISFVCFFYYLLFCFLLVSATFRFLFGLQVTVGTESRKHPQIRAHSDTALWFWEPVWGEATWWSRLLRREVFFFLSVFVCVFNNVASESSPGNVIFNLLFLLLSRPLTPDLAAKPTVTDIIDQWVIASAALLETSKVFTFNNKLSGNK